MYKDSPSISKKIFGNFLVKHIFQFVKYLPGQHLSQNPVRFTALKNSATSLKTLQQICSAYHLGGMTVHRMKQAFV